MFPAIPRDLADEDLERTKTKRDCFYLLDLETFIDGGDGDTNSPYNFVGGMCF